MTTLPRRFRVALSFPGEERDYVRTVADMLVSALGDGRVLYDEYLTAELARPNLDLYLTALYREHSDLLVPFFCEEYERKKWCLLEWRQLRDLLLSLDDHRIMPLRFDDTSIPGLLSIDGYVTIANRSPAEVADLILQRLADTTPLDASGDRSGYWTSPFSSSSTDSRSASPMAARTATSYVMPVALRRGGGVLSPLPQEHRPHPTLLTTFLGRVASFVAADQIDTSGGWAKSQERIFEHTTGQTLSRLDRREGGIISTYIAVRALAAAGVDLVPFSEPGKAATKYLLDRQTRSGLFGRYSQSRSGEEIKPSFRHTALASLALMILDGPPDSIARGLQCLVGVNRDDILDEAAPSIAAATVILALETATRGEWGHDHLPTQQRQSLERTLRTLSPQLTETVESESRNPSSPYAPLWLPYGRSPRMVYDSALTLVDLLTLWSRPPWACIVRALQYLADRRIEGALPYDPGEGQADVGVSAYFASICYRHRVAEQLARRDRMGVIEAARDCLAFSVANLEDPSSTRRTYCDTLANGILLTPNAVAE